MQSKLFYNQFMSNVIMVTKWQFPRDFQNSSQAQLCIHLRLNLCTCHIRVLLFVIRDACTCGIFKLQNKHLRNLSSTVSALESESFIANISRFPLSPPTASFVHQGAEGTKEKWELEPHWEKMAPSCFQKPHKIREPKPLVAIPGRFCIN